MEQTAADEGADKGADQDRPIELRLLTGPNLYFPRPAVKLTLDASGVQDAVAAQVVAWQRALGVREPTVGLSHSPARAGAAAELAATVVVAYPIRHRTTAELFGDAVAAAFAAITRRGADPERALDTVSSALSGHDPGEIIAPLRPTIPVIAVTGTNGKTTTTRLIAHLVKTGGRVPGWS